MGTRHSVFQSRSTLKRQTSRRRYRILVRWRFSVSSNMDEGGFKQARGVKHSTYWPTINDSYHTKFWFHMQVYYAFNDQCSSTQNNTHLCITPHLLASLISLIFSYHHASLNPCHSSDRLCLRGNGARYCALERSRPCRSGPSGRPSIVGEKDTGGSMEAAKREV